MLSFGKVVKLDIKYYINYLISESIRQFPSAVCCCWQKVFNYLTYRKQAGNAYLFFLRTMIVLIKIYAIVPRTMYSDLEQHLTEQGLQLHDTRQMCKRGREEKRGLDVNAYLHY